MTKLELIQKKEMYHFFFHVKHSYNIQNPILKEMIKINQEDRIQTLFTKISQYFWNNQINTLIVKHLTILQ